MIAAHRALIEERFRERNQASAAFFEREAAPLARIARAMSDRFTAGGRLLAVGSGAAASDAQHVAVEFVHPVIVGKRALPALDLSTGYTQRLRALVRKEDVVLGLGPPGGDPEIAAALREAGSRGALTLALPGTGGDYAVAAPSADPFIHQELMEVLYHALWETVHLFFERETVASDAGAASFLYPFLGEQQAVTDSVLSEAAASIRAKARQDEHLREQVVSGQGDRIVAAAAAVAERLARGGGILVFGNGGSATDANDLAMDLVASPKSYAPVPAVSLSMDPATVTAIANDIGADAIFLRQVIAYGRSQDVAVAISTSGGSRNIIAALTEARSRGLLTIALLGYDGGEIHRRGLADHTLVIASDQIPRIQEVHASVYHVLLDLLEALRDR